MAKTKRHIKKLNKMTLIEILLIILAMLVSFTVGAYAMKETYIHKIDQDIARCLEVCGLLSENLLRY